MVPFIVSVNANFIKEILSCHAEVVWCTVAGLNKRQQDEPKYFNYEHQAKKLNSASISFQNMSLCL